MEYKVINKIARTYFLTHSKNRKQSLKYQHKFIKELIKDCKYTKFGQEYDFKNIKNISDFQKKVPVFHYEEFWPWIEEMMKWESDISYPGIIVKFAKTGWTTSKANKYVPLTYDSLKTNHFQASKTLLSRYCKENPETKIFEWKTMSIGWGTDVNPYTGEENVAYISAMLQKEAPMFSSMFKEPSLDISFLPNWEDKIQKILETTVHKNIVAMAGIPPWCIHIMKEVLAYTGKEKIQDVWPNFEMFFTGGTWFEPYRKQFEEIWDVNKTRVRQVYNSSEWFFAVQNSNDDHESMFLLTNHGVFYEFLKREDYLSQSYDKAITLDKVEEWVNYVMIITTNAGLRRYVQWDTVMFTSTKPYKIKITGRTKFFIDSFNEHMLADHTDKAILRACEKIGAIFREYTAGPNFSTEEWKWAHEWIIEFEKEPENIEDFANILDDELKIANDNYASKRYGSMIMQRVIVHSAPTGTFYKWLEKKGKLGGQSKVPKLVNGREVLEEILELMWH